MKDFDENMRFTITPKGILWMTMYELGMMDDVIETSFNALWELFETRMKKHGYIVEGGDEG